MKLIESYALKCGAKIDKPFIQQSFYPLSCDKYITINNSSQMPAKQYFYLNEVLNIIGPELKKNGIEIIQLGDANEPQYPNVIRLAGQTNIYQSAHIISNSLLHLGIDSFLVHCAATFDIPIVGLYSVSPPSICGPQFGTEERQTCLEPNFPDGFTYSQNPQEPQRFINTIKIEDICAAVEKLIGIPIPKIKTQYIGTQFANTIIEFVPAEGFGVIPPQLFSNVIPLIRMDLLGATEEVARQQIATRKCALLTDKPIDLNSFVPLKPHLERIIYTINKDYDLNFVKSLYSFGVPFIFLTDLPPDEVDLIRLDCAEFGIIFPRPKGKRPDISITDRTVYKTNRFIFANGKTYLSEEHLRQDKHSDGSNRDKIIDNENFWKDSEFYFCLDVL